MNEAFAQLLTEQAATITEAVITADYARRPELLERYGEPGQALYRRDNQFHLSFLAEAVATGEEALFTDYVGWARSMLAAHGVLTEDLVENLRLLREVLCQQLPEEAVPAVVAPIDAALAELPSLPAEPPSFILPDTPYGALAREFLERLLAGDRRGATRMIDSAVADGVPLPRIYLDIFQQSQREIGRLWQLNRITVAQEHFCTAATLTIMNGLYRHVLDAPRTGLRVTAFCVAGDLHEIGLRIVADFFELEGWDCDYIGASTPGDDLLKSISSAPPDLVAVSATMTYHVSIVREFIQKMRAHPILGDIPVIVGGRPFLVSEGLWRTVGASGWAVDAQSAVSEAAVLVGRSKA